MPRGQIEHRGRAVQVRDFTGLRFGNITPTDVDGLLDFGNKLFVFIEAKANDKELPLGQKLALERVCDAVQAGGKRAVLLLVRHDTHPDEDIDFASTTVVGCRMNGKWLLPTITTSCRSMIDWLVSTTAGL